MRKAGPAGSIWFAFGMSRHRPQMVTQAMILGGHAHVDLEDTLYIPRNPGTRRRNAGRTRGLHCSRTRFC
ncbi:3-keto-5-aminohexanoate cleavage protein [Methylobacterium aquaticum]|uniref:3-keto-5-aminohexanoate cleavage protein n=1 Tax=Methylobacterium aquaticum TaxID=270351 RepID=UPI003CC9FCB2